jgi:hypothetical protein
MSPRQRHRPRRPDLDERFSLPEDTDPDEVLRRILGTPRPVESHEETEDPGREDEATEP